MTNRYIVFDVETPNGANSRMSAIGIAVVENGRIVSEYSTYINPETHFDPFNIQLTGITPELVADKPTFPEVWEQIRPIFDSGILVAHYALFDMRVLAMCLSDYGIVWQDKPHYSCTYLMGRACYPNLPNHKLNTLCDHLGIALKHHDASSDSRASAKLLIDYTQKRVNPLKFTKRYDMANLRMVK